MEKSQLRDALRLRVQQEGCKQRRTVKRKKQQGPLRKLVCARRSTGCGFNGKMFVLSDSVITVVLQAEISTSRMCTWNHRLYLLNR